MTYGVGAGKPVDNVYGQEKPEVNNGVYPDVKIRELGFSDEVLTQMTEAAKDLTPKELHAYSLGEIKIWDLGASVTAEDLNSIKGAIDESIWNNHASADAGLGVTACCCCGVTIG